MSNKQLNQLRFDISEKIRLHPQQPGIESLVELDLYPDVEVLDEGEQLKIQGFLRLNGSYIAGSDPGEAAVQRGNHEEIAYVIPVEITIPSDRAEVSNISAEVETFDYHVISPFELQVEAILLIDGLIHEENTTASVAVVEELDKQEEMVKEPSFSAQSIEAVETVVPEENQFREYLDAPGTSADGSFPELHFSSGSDIQDTPRKNSEPASVEYLNDIWNKRRVGVEISAEEQFAQDQFAMEKGVEEGSVPVSTKPSMGSRLDRNTAWVDWLVQSKEESFASLRMVIIQKDESIDTVAEKYGISSKQLLRINRLENDGLAEGQIVYVPRQLQPTS